MTFSQQMMMGLAMNPDIELVNANASDSVITPGTCTVSFRVDTDGNTYTITTNGGQVLVNQWITPLGQQANFEVQAVTASGTAPNGGTLGSYQALTVDRTWSQIQAIIGSRSGTITVTIRRIGSLIVLATATITLSAEVTS